MASTHSTTLPETEDLSLPAFDERLLSDGSGPSIVILYNDDYHEAGEVVMQLRKATGYDVERCVMIMLEANNTGRSVAYTGSEPDCERVAGVLRQIRLQVETDRM